MSKHYAFLKEPQFGLDRVLVGPGVNRLLSPETAGLMEELDVPAMLDKAHQAGWRNSPACSGPLTPEQLWRKMKEVTFGFVDDEHQDHCIALAGEVLTKPSAGRPQKLQVGLVVSRLPKECFDVLDERERDALMAPVAAFVKALRSALVEPPCAITSVELERLVEKHLPGHGLSARPVAAHSPGEAAHVAGLKTEEHS